MMSSRRMFWRERQTTTTARAYARAALVGNPSDGYGGRTVAFTFRELHADVTVTAAERLTIDAERGEGALLRTAYGRFLAYCVDNGGSPKPCKLSLRSSIPAQAGLGASSAIIVAALRALCAFNQVPMPEVEKPLAAQVYDGLVYLDGVHERIDADVLDQAYVAWCPRVSVNSAGFHRELDRRYRTGDKHTVSTLGAIAELAKAARDAVAAGDRRELDSIVDANFELRRRLGPLEPHHIRMIEVARAAGASANYAGSGGAITGFVRGADAYAELTCAMAAFGCMVIRPSVAG